MDTDDWQIHILISFFSEYAIISNILTSPQEHTEDKGSYMVDGPKSIRLKRNFLHSAPDYPQEGWYNDHLQISSKINSFI